MKATIMRRSAAAAAVLTLSLSLAACGEEDEPATDAGGDTTSGSSAPAEEPSTPAEEPTTEEGGGMPAGAENVFGPACGQVPTSGEGSVEGMIDDPVGTAASNNPLLNEALVPAVQAAGLLDTLNDTNAQYTVFAPVNDAFGALGDTATQLINQASNSNDPTNSPLAQILLHHVVSGQLDPTMVVGDQETVNGDMITVAGDPESGMTVSDGQVTANVLCGGVPTANATVYVIDMVLAGATVN